jgi:hypothetical protein
MTYNKPITGLRKTQLTRLALDLDLPSDGTVVELRNRISAVLTARENILSHDPKFKKLYPRRHQNAAVSPVNSQPSTRNGTPTLSASSSWYGIHEPEAQDLDPLPDRSLSPVSTLAHVDYRGMHINIYYINHLYDVMI